MWGISVSDINYWVFDSGREGHILKRRKLLLLNWDDIQKERNCSLITNEIWHLIDLIICLPPPSFTQFYCELLNDSTKRVSPVSHGEKAHGTEHLANGQVVQSNIYNPSKNGFKKMQMRPSWLKGIPCDNTTKRYISALYV